MMSSPYYETLPLPADGDLPPLEAYLDDLRLAQSAVDWRPVKAATAMREPYRLLTRDDLASTQTARDLVRGVLPRFGIAGIYGASMSGKGFWLIGFAAACGEGGDWFGLPVEKVRVVYVVLEGAAGMPKRITAWEIENGRPYPDDVVFVMQPYNLRCSDDTAALVEAVRASGFAGGLVIIDTLNQASPGSDENSSRDMGEIIAATRRIQTELGGLVLLVSHVGKDQSKGLRGHSSLMAALDAAVEVRREGDRREWLVAKSKDDKDGAIHGFRLRVIDAGVDDDGQTITSCVVVPEEPAEAYIRKTKIPAGGNQRIVWDALGELLRGAGAERPTTAPKDLPAGRPAVRLENAISKLHGRLPEVEPKRQKERITQAITGLVNRGVLVLRAGWVWAA